jgi:hypothetical protein
MVLIDTNHQCLRKKLPVDLGVFWKWKPKQTSLIHIIDSWLKTILVIYNFHKFLSKHFYFLHHDTQRFSVSSHVHNSVQSTKPSITHLEIDFNAIC